MSLEEDVVVGSSTLINYLGRFETLEDALNTYPEGGNEGDYIYVGDDIHAWDKYGNEWVVSSDAPLEVSISEEDVIPNSNTFINYLGGFVDRDAVWHKYPEGGKVGDYLYIASDLHIWDKYICNWVAATPPDESSQIRPIEVLTQEGVVEYSENYINYLGVFESIEQAWEAYPEGGKEGDYIIVGGEQLRWNKYTSNWGEYDPDASTPARPVATIYGDLHVHNDVVIGEDLYARILETFTTKKWVLEQGYIFMDDVTSELVMSKIVPDNTTIEVRDGKLVVIGGGTADSVAWDDVTGKPDWIGDTKPTYTLDEIAGSNGDGFVTLLSDQTIEGVKNFANGAKFNGALLSYDEEKKAWVFPGNIIASGGITAFGSLSTPVVSLFEALPIDGTTIKRDPITNELYVDTNEVGGSGGGSLDEEQLEEFLRPYATIEYVSNNYTTKTSVDKALSDKANKATTLAGYGITDAYTKSDIDATVDSINTSISNLRKYADDTFVTISTPQKITARHNFIDGLKINGLPIYNSQDDVVYIDANLVVRGGVTAWGTNEETAPNIFEGLPIDGTSIYWDNGVLKSSATSSGGINEELLEEYLRPYATQSWVTDMGYITGITGAMVTSALGYTPYNSANFTKANIKSTLGISDWALASAKPSYSYSEISGTPTSLKNPNALSWSGYSSGSYDGSLAQSIALPTKLSQLTDDVVSGKYLSLSGGTVSGDVTANNFIATNALKTNTGIRDCINIVTTYNYPAIAMKGSNHTAGYVRLFNRGGADWAVTDENWTNSYTLLHSGNYSNYALPKDGTAVAATTLKTSTGYMYARAFNVDKIVDIGADATLQGYSTYIDGMYIRFRYGSANATAMQIGTDGKISIGGTTADELLHVYGVAKATLLKSAQGYTLTSSAATYCGLIPNNIITGSGNATDFWLYNVTDIKYQAANHYFVGGNVAIGGTTASEKLHVYGAISSENTNADAGFRARGSTYALFFGIGSGNVNRGIYDDYHKGWWIMRGADKTTTIDGSMVASGLRINQSDFNNGLTLNRTSTNAGAGIVFRSNDSLLGQIGINGTKTFEVSDGTTIKASIEIPTGNLLIKGVLTMNQSSDERLKKNIRKVNASKVLMSLGGVWQYEYVESEVQKNSVYNGTHFGLIYQNVKGKSLDKMCHTREDGMGALNYVDADFISIIAGATMENISEVEKLKRKIRTLENKVKQLERVA